MPFALNRRHSPSADQAVIKNGPIARFRATSEEVDRKRHERVKQVVQLMLIATDVRPALPTNLVDRLQGQGGQPLRSRLQAAFARRRQRVLDALRDQPRRERHTDLHSAARAQNCDGTWSIHGEATDGAVLDSSENLGQAFEVHSLTQNILHHLIDQQVIGNLDVALDILEACVLPAERRWQEDLQSVCAESVARRACPSRSAEAAGCDSRAQRQRVLKMGDANDACSSSSFTVCSVRNWKTSASGKLCCSASEMLIPLSVAAACSSKLKPRQKRLRRASPQALLMRPPKGACRMSCIPPPSSKKRSAMIVVFEGTEPRTARPVTTYSISC